MASPRVVGALTLTDVAGVGVEIAFLIGAGIVLEQIQFIAPRRAPTTLPCPAKAGAGYVTLDISDHDAFVKIIRGVPTAN